MPKVEVNDSSVGPGIGVLDVSFSAPGRGMMVSCVVDIFPSDWKNLKKPGVERWFGPT